MREPNDLIRLCYQYGLREIPVSKNGSIRGSIRKKDLVSHLSKSDRFELDILKTIERLTEPVDGDLLSELRTELQDGNITGIPIVGFDGEVKRVITPGVLKAEEESREFLDQARQRELYESLLNELPFPICLYRDDSRIFENRKYKEFDPGSDRWDKMTIERDDLTMNVFLPAVLHRILDRFETLHSGGTIDLRGLLDYVEEEFMKQTRVLTETISEAASRVDLPRQTFNYRWNQKVENNSSD